MKPYYDRDGITIYHGDCREVLPTLPLASAFVTSPPYWGGVRDYGSPAQLGFERQPAAYVAELLDVMRLVRLEDDGSGWLNIGDTYAASGKGGGKRMGSRRCWASIKDRKGFRSPPPGYKFKDLTLTPFQAAATLREDGWYLRSVVVWEKPSAVEPLRFDRPSVSHEYVFQLSKAEVYFVAECREKWWGRSVWKIAQDGSLAHPATMPYELARRCIVVSTPVGGLVLDPFAGSGTTLRAAKDLGRRAIGVELEERYCEIAARRLEQGVLQFSEART